MLYRYVEPRKDGGGLTRGRNPERVIGFRQKIEQFILRRPRWVIFLIAISQDFEEETNETCFVKCGDANINGKAGFPRNIHNTLTLQTKQQVMV